MAFSRWGNVSGALLLDSTPAATAAAEAARMRIARQLDAVLAETLVLGRDVGERAWAGPGRFVPLAGRVSGRLTGLLRALEVASGDRVLVIGGVPPDLPLDLLLALLAWPEADAVVLAEGEGGGGGALCGIYRREALLPTARKRLEANAPSVVDFHAAIAASRVSLERLGLEDLAMAGAPDSFLAARASTSEVR